MLRARNRLLLSPQVEMKQSIQLLPPLQAAVDFFDFNKISEERKVILNQLTDYLRTKLEQRQEITLQFICTHNSRRSQLAQVWGQMAAAYFDLPVRCLSGGVEVTAFNERAVASLQRFGFEVEPGNPPNPVYHVRFAIEAEPVMAYSKLFDDPVNAAKSFAAVMTCAEADENCPYIPGAEVRIPLRYEDPKAFDDTPLEAEKYDERSRQIGTELLYAFSKVASGA